jgi:hypothetical protein
MVILVENINKVFEMRKTTREMLAVYDDAPV